MKIAVWHNLVFGGGARALNYHLQGLVRKGHSLEIWSPDPLIGGFIRMPDQVKIHQIPLDRKPQTSYLDRVKSVFFDKDFNMNAMERHCQQCADEINQGDFDVLFANSCYYYAVPFISRFVHIPTILYLGEPYRFFFEAHPHSIWESPSTILDKTKFDKIFYWEWCKDIWKTSKARVQLREERINVEAADRLLLNSLYSAESCVRAYNTVGDVCYLGVDTKIFKPIPTRKTADYVISVGAFYPHKDPELAIQSIALIKEKRPKLLWVANLIDKEFAEEMQKLAVELGVDFELREMICDDELVNLLNHAICMVYTARLEPFGFAPLEANACQIPVICLRQGGVKEIIIDGKTGFLCSACASEIAERIDYFIHRPEVREKMGRNALKNVLLHWTLDAATDRLENAIVNTVWPASNVSLESRLA